MNGPKIYFTIPIFGGIPITQTTVSSFVVMIFLCTAGILLGRKLKKRPGKMQVLTEKLVGMLYDLVESTMGKHNSYWTPYIGALFLNAGLLKFLKGYVNPMNIISDIAQPVSMSFRHFGNIMGGGVLMSLLYSALASVSVIVIGLIKSNGIVCAAAVILIGAGLIIWGVKKKKAVRGALGGIFVLLGIVSILESLGAFSGVPVLTLGVPGVLSLYFDIFSGLVQALVFSLLTMVYVSNACPPPEEG